MKGNEFERKWLSLQSGTGMTEVWMIEVFRTGMALYSFISLELYRYKFIQVDSGGALLVNGVAYGIYSWGYGCDHPGKTRKLHILDFWRLRTKKSATFVP